MKAVTKAATNTKTTAWQHQAHWSLTKPPRPIQQEAIDRAIDAFDAGKRFVILEAPCGTGKSAVAMTLARHYGTAWICTLTKALQQQYMAEPDFAPLELREIKGRSAYKCTRARGTCEAGGELYSGENACSPCPYQQAKAEAYKARFAICNYHSFIYNVSRQATKKKDEEPTVPRELLVLDEGHELEDVLMSYVSVSVRPAALPGRFDRPLPSDPENVDAHFSWLTALCDYLKPQIDLAPTPEKRAEIKRFIDKARFAVNTKDTAHWIVDAVKDRAGKTSGFDLKPLTVQPFGRIFFKTAERILIMSGTILSSDAICKSLGIDPNAAEYIELPCTFPAENRPIRTFHLDMRKDAREHSWPAAVQVIADILEFHKAQKGLLLAPSTEMLKYLQKNLPRDASKRLLLAYGDKRAAILEQHLTGDAPTVLAASGMWEGVDLYEDRARFQILAALPRPYWGSAQVRARSKLDYWWYDWKTFSKTCQGLMRAIRSETDVAATYVLDAAFAQHAARQHNCLIPQWMRDGIVTGA